MSWGADFRISAMSRLRLVWQLPPSPPDLAIASAWSVCARVHPRDLSASTRDFLGGLDAHAVRTIVLGVDGHHRYPTSDIIFDPTISLHALRADSSLFPDTLRGAMLCSSLLICCMRVRRR